MIRGWDLGGLIHSLWANKSIPPSWLLERTPFELVTLFTRKDTSKPEIVDRLQLLIEANLKRAKAGLKPHIPPWFLEQLKPKKEPDHGRRNRARKKPR